MSENETIHESDTGAKKARNDVRMSLVPTEELLEVARHYSRGASKYGDFNWAKGMPFSWHYDAMQRHLLTYWGGEDIDAETGSEHLDAVIFHALGLKYGRKHHPDQDDRYVAPNPPISTSSVMGQVDSLEDDAPAWVKAYEWASREGLRYRWIEGGWKFYLANKSWWPSFNRNGPFTRVEK